jgi:hypothetical protein
MAWHVVLSIGLRYTSRMDNYSKMCAMLLVGLLLMLFASGFRLAYYGEVSPACCKKEDAAKKMNG